MIAELDIGNTRCKWRLVQGVDVVARGESVADLLGRLPTHAPLELIRIASVQSQQQTQALIDALQGAVAAPMRMAQSSSRCGDVINGYREPARLGVDRWLALVAAWHMARRDAVVVDAGSALTIDVIEYNGLHRGGYIFPGPALLAETLLSRTARVRFEPAELLARSLVPGGDTRQCVETGVSIATLGAVMTAIRQAESLLGRDVDVVVCGGFGERLAGLLEDAGYARWRLVPDLVLDGLRWVAP